MIKAVTLKVTKIGRCKDQFSMPLAQLKLIKTDKPMNLCLKG